VRRVANSRANPDQTLHAEMVSTHNRFLIAGASLSAFAALLHLACIVFGAPMYRALGAGEQMAQMAADGHWYPTMITLAIAAILGIWSLYALSGAGAIRRLPLLRVGLCVITGIYLLRGVAFVALMGSYPDNSMTFWIVSSAICLAIGCVHFLGLRQVWNKISVRAP
jgi:hypothetical protein